MFKLTCPKCGKNNLPKAFQSHFSGDDSSPQIYRLWTCDGCHTHLKIKGRTWLLPAVIGIVVLLVGRHFFSKAIDPPVIPFILALCLSLLMTGLAMAVFTKLEIVSDMEWFEEQQKFKKI